MLIACSGSNPDARVASSTPPTAGTAATAGDPIVGLSRGPLAACAVRASGHVDCWGLWKNEQADRGVQRLQGIDDARQVVVSGGICVLRKSGVACLNGLGEWHPISGTKHIVQLSSGHGACGIEQNGAVRCWDPWGRSHDTEKVDGAKDVIAVAATSFGFECALERAGTVACRVQQGPFHPIVGLSDVHALALGFDNFAEGGGRYAEGCALLAKGVRCFALDSDLHLSAPWTAKNHYPEYKLQLPEAPPELAGASSVTVSENNVVTAQVGGEVIEIAGSTRKLPGLADTTLVTNQCALRRDNSVACWGSNADGNLGRETTSHRFITEPKEVAGVSDAVAIGVEWATSWAITKDGRVFHWGDSEPSWHRMEGTFPTLVPVSSRPIPVTVLASPQLSVASLDFGGTCLAGRDGNTRCFRTELMDVHPLHGASELENAREGVIARMTGGATVRFSGNEHDPLEPLHGPDDLSRARTGCTIGSGGQITCKIPENRRPPTSMTATIPDAVALSGTDSTTCARRKSGKVSCFGVAFDGLLGPGDDNDYGPREIPGIDDAEDVIVGDNLACAIRAKGRLTCWGHFLPIAHLRGQTGSPDPAPQPPKDVFASGVQRVAITLSHACAQLATGHVACWGFNAEGELGDGTLLSSDEPLAVPGL
jgi:alpha-tubulin suppressor-like RCC1 family protein